MKRQRRAMRRRVEERLEAERHLLMDTDSDSANDETDEVEQQEHVREPFEPDEAMNVDPQDGHLVAHGPVGPAGDGNAEPQEIEMHSDEGHSTASEGDQVVPPLNPIQFYSTTQVPPEERKAELCRALAAVKAQTLTTDSGMDKMLKVRNYH